MSLERHREELNKNWGFHCPLNDTIKCTINVLSTLNFIIKNRSDRESYELKKRCLNTLLSVKQKLKYIESKNVFKHTLHSECFPLFEFYHTYNENDIQKCHIFECLEFFEENITQFQPSSLAVHYAFKKLQINDTSLPINNIIASQRHAIDAIITTVMKLKYKENYTEILHILFDVTQTFTKTKVHSWINPIIHTVLLVLSNHERQLLITTLTANKNQEYITTLFTSLNSAFTPFTPDECSQFQSYCSKLNIPNTQWINSLYFINNVIKYNQQVISVCNSDHLLTLFQKLKITSSIYH